MEKIRCTTCQARLKLPASYAGGTIKCPKCGVPFSARMESARMESARMESARMESARMESARMESARMESARTESARSAAPAERETPPPFRKSRGSETPDIRPVTDETVAVAADPVPRENSANPAGSGADGPPGITGTLTDSTRRTLAVPDFGFQRFLTPLIIRVSWVSVVLLAVLWLLFLLAAYVGSFFFDSGPSTAGTLMGQGLDLESVLQGQGDVSSLNRLLDGLTGSGNVEASEPTLFQRFQSFGFGLLSLLTLVVSLILSVLWCRVMFETIVVVFEIASRLKSIDEKTGPGPATPAARQATRPRRLRPPD